MGNLMWQEPRAMEACMALVGGRVKEARKGS